MSTVVKIQPKDIGSIPYQEASYDIWDKKYRLIAKDGSPVDRSMDDTYKRVARALADVELPELREQWYESFLWALRHGAIPAGRVTSNAGALEHKPATSTINCTVSGTIRDSMDDILNKVHEAGLTLKAGCVAPGTLVRTDRGLVTADRAVAEKHREILCYDREEHRFEMRPILEHMITRVPREENIRIRSNGAALTTSVKHPVLVHRSGRFMYARADEVELSDSLVHFQFDWSADTQRWMEAWFAGAHLGDGSAYQKNIAYKPSRSAWARRANALGRRLVFKMRAAEREVVERYAAFFAAFSATRAAVTAMRTKLGTPVWDSTVASFEASPAAELIDGQIGDKCGTMRVPRWISAEPGRYFLPFLAGLIDTDGIVTTAGNACIGMKSAQFAAELKSLLALFGIRSSTTSIAPRDHELDGVLVRGSAHVVLKICDSAFLDAVARYMADSGKRNRIAEYATTSGQYDVHQMLPALRTALEAEGSNLDHIEKQRLGFYHGYSNRDRVSRVWLDRWETRFPALKALIALTRCLRPVDAIERELPLSETFFDFTVDKHNNYVAGNDGLMVIHNCGIGYEFSTLRPRGAYVSGAGAYTSGPLSFMDIYDKMCFTVSSAGGRRGAQMGTFDVGHPDVLEFIRAKRENGRLRQFNLSLLVTDEFMQAVKSDGEWRLAFPLARNEYEAERPDLEDTSRFVWREWPDVRGYVANEEGLVACKIYKTLPARRVWDLIMSSTYDFAEPGFILIDRVNEMNNNWWEETIRATNPCVTADTRLATQFGMVRIGDLHDARVDIHATVDSRALGEGMGVAVRPAVPAFMTSPSADVYRVVTEDGYEIKATEWHDFYTARGKIKLKDLQVGDELMIQSGKGQFGGCGSEEFGRLLGLLTGDGHFTNRGKGEEAAVVNQWATDRVLAESVVAHVNSLIAGYAENGREYRASAVAVPERNLVMIRSVILARVLANQWFTAKCKTQVPEIVWRGNEECVKGYLRGLFQADGTVQRDDKNAYCTIRLSSSRQSLLKDVQVLLANCGIFCRILKRRAAGQRMLPDGRDGSRFYACRADYELLIGSESRDRFMQEIGFLTEEKNQKYQQWKQERRSARSENFLSPIATIEYVGREAVYDTTQPDKNNLIFNGLVTGNCGEQPLPPYGSCLLGSVNLTKFVVDPFTEDAHFDWETYRKVVKIFTRMLDNVVEVNGLPLAQQRNEIMRKRRHGMGFLGLGSSITMLCMKYGSKKSIAFTQNVAREMALAGWEAGLELAREKGPAPIMNEEFTVTREMLRKRPEMAKDGWRVGAKIAGRVLHARYSRYMQRIAEAAPELVEELAETGSRFTHHSSIAPTGTISLSLANNASNGIEPSFAHHYFRNVIREGKKSKEKIDVFSFELLAYREMVNPRAMPPSSKDPAQSAAEKLPDYFVSADDIGPREHVDIQAAAQLWVDSSISKTANVPTDYKYEDFKDIYLHAFEQGLKGCTTFRFNPEAFQGVLVKEDDLKNTIYVFTLEDGTEVEARGDQEIEYDGEMHTAANLFDALKEGYYGKF